MRIIDFGASLTMEIATGPNSIGYRHANAIIFGRPYNAADNHAVSGSSFADISRQVFNLVPMDGDIYCELSAINDELSYSSGVPMPAGYLTLLREIIATHIASACSATRLLATDPSVVKAGSWSSYAPLAMPNEMCTSSGGTIDFPLTVIDGKFGVCIYTIFNDSSSFDVLVDGVKVGNISSNCAVDPSTVLYKGGGIGVGVNVGTRIAYFNCASGARTVRLVAQEVGGNPEAVAFVCTGASVRPFTLLGSPISHLAGDDTPNINANTSAAVADAVAQGYAAAYYDVGSAASLIYPDDYMDQVHPKSSGNVKLGLVLGSTR
jgi:hypothetical protein